jgi:hypothetical protein
MNMLFRPTPLPDELDRSYLGRIMRTNRFQTEKEAVVAMATRFDLACKSRRDLSCLELLSLTGDKSLEAFALEHSTIPLRRAVTSSMPNLPHGSPTRRSLLYNFGMVAVREGAYFCATCASEDLSNHGVGYWRRAHQIPGQLWCRDHHTPLHYRKTDDAFLQSTSSYIADASIVPDDWVVAARNNELVLRYTALVCALIKRNLPLDVKFVARALRHQALARGLNTVAAPVKNRPLLSDLIQESFPTFWLTNVAPSVVGKAKGQILNRVDGVLYLATSASTAWHYILAASVLYESAEDALHGLVSAKADFSKVPRQRSRKTYEDLDPRALAAVYVECNGHHALVAERLSVPIHRASAVLRAAGLPNLMGDNSKSKSIRSAAHALYIQRKSFEESARIGGLTATEMSDLIRYSATPFKSTLTAMSDRKEKRGTGVKRIKGFMPQEAKGFFGATLGTPHSGQGFSASGA